MVLKLAASFLHECFRKRKCILVFLIHPVVLILLYRIHFEIPSLMIMKTNFQIRNGCFGISFLTHSFGYSIVIDSRLMPFRWSVMVRVGSYQIYGMEEVDGAGRDKGITMLSIANEFLQHPSVSLITLQYPKNIQSLVSKPETTDFSTILAAGDVVNYWNNRNLNKECFCW